MVYKRRNTIANRAVRKIQRRFRKRYIQRKGGVRFGKLARDVSYLKSALNTERKMLITNIQEAPTVTVPTLTRLNTPDVQGTTSTKRVGAKVRFTHMSGKLRVQHQNFGDKFANATTVMYIIWLKNGEYASEFESQFASLMFNPDQNNQYSPMCYFSKVKYDSWIATWKRKVVCTDLVPLNQVALGLPNTGVNQNATLSTLGRGGQKKNYYVEFNKKISVPVEWNNTYSTSGDTDEISRNVPYLLCMTDCPGETVPSGSSTPDSLLNDKIIVQGTIRSTWIDN